MKNVVYNGTLFICFLLVVLLHTQVVSNNIRTAELNQAVDLATNQALREAKTSAYGITTSESLISSFMQGLMVQMNSNTKLSVRVLAADIDKGILEVEVQGEFMHLTRTTKTIVIRRCIIYEPPQVV